MPYCLVVPVVLARIMAGGIYVGGKLWINDQDGGKLYYSSGRYEFDTRCGGTHVPTRSRGDA